MTTIQIFINIFGAFGALTTVCLGFPQLLRLRKTKDSGNVKFLPYWIFFVGLLAWLVYGVFNKNEQGWYIFLSNFLCTLIYSFTMFYLYKYKKDYDKKMMWKPILGIILCELVALAMFAVFIVTVWQKLKFGKFYDSAEHTSVIPTFDETTALIIGLISPSFTTLAFLPQLIISLKKKDFRGQTPWMPLIFMMNNTWWIIYFALTLVSMNNIINDPNVAEAIRIQTKGGLRGIIGGITWQIVSLTVYGIQTAFIFNFESKMRKQEKLNPQTIK
ncbi:hypothetical protein FJO69_01775 [[Mycoplasma] falconis]|uniref:PQ-loop repeat-containing protein n=1 Tax=[Mycoplasma] falconis TaxID=92403 RepID=A0A501XA89_9BACT|nr:SemiSWEET family transporter [[Mycoplasma] falconis]TPE57339.1 hypothetical protein FJO69_01775 [[Mycoplasma] falconis]